MKYAEHGDGLPDQIPDASTLYLTTPNGDAESSLHRVMTREQVESTSPFPGVVAIGLTMNKLRSLSSAWASELSLDELRDTKCRLSESSGEPPLRELMQTYSLSSLIAWVNGQWLADVIQTERLVTFFQPIVRSDHPNEVFAYECLLRGHELDGELISPFRLYSAARDTGTLNVLDQAARLTAIDSFTKKQLHTDACVFINMNPRSIQDPTRCLDSTLRAAIASGVSTERFVFEVVESDEIVDPEGLMQILDYCREAGCRVALDDLGAGYSSLNLMARIKPDFIKLDMDLIRDVDHDAYKSSVANKLLELANELGVKTVAEGVETCGEWQWVVEHGADFAQGYYFARPEADPPLVTVEHSQSNA